MFGLSETHFKLLKSLNTPIKIQSFLDSLPQNYEKKGETYMSPERSLLAKKAHCIEAALIAATALWINGEQPLLMDLKAYPHDMDHVVALYKINGYFGAISKTNHATVRFRDPIYRTTRELALSYFHEYFLNSNGKKTLKSYSATLNLKQFGKKWIIAKDDLWNIAEALDKAKHFPLVPKKNIKHIRKADHMEIKASSFIEWKKSDPRT